MTVWEHSGMGRNHDICICKDMINAVLVKSALDNTVVRSRATTRGIDTASYRVEVDIEPMFGDEKK